MPATPHDDVVAAQRGDALAADRLITEFHRPIYAFLRRLAGRDEDAEDLTQRTFARVWTSLGSYAGTSSVSSWMHGIAHHVYLDWRRADRRSEPQTDEWWQNQVAPGPCPAEIAAHADLTGGIYAAVDRLDPAVRSAVHLHYYQGLTLQETAEVLGMATSTVKYRLRAALEELQAVFVRRPDFQAKLQNHRS
jgi:RNA polymerase sigma-70 factor (ECF subfamily)